MSETHSKCVIGVDLLHTSTAAGGWQVVVVAPMAPFPLRLCLLYLPFEELYEVDGRCGSVARSETPFGGT